MILPDFDLENKDAKPQKPKNKKTSKVPYWLLFLLFFFFASSLLATEYNGSERKIRKKSNFKKFSKNSRKMRN